MLLSPVFDDGVEFVELIGGKVPVCSFDNEFLILLFDIVSP